MPAPTRDARPAGSRETAGDETGWRVWLAAPAVDVAEAEIVGTLVGAMTEMPFEMELVLPLVLLVLLTGDAEDVSEVVVNTGDVDLIRKSF